MSAVECTICENVYGAYAVPLSSSHRPAAQAILSGGIWEPETVDLIRNNSAGQDVVHAGTYFGDFLPALADTARTVYAFEPNQENFECALWTM